MSTEEPRVLLITNKSDEWEKRVRRAIEKASMDMVGAYNCWSGEAAIEKHPADVIVIDTHVLCTSHTKNRPGPILSRSPKTPVIVTNCADLDDAHREVAVGHGATLMEGDEAEDIIDAVRGALATRPDAGS